MTALDKLMEKVGKIQERRDELIAQKQTQKIIAAPRIKSSRRRTSAFLPTGEVLQWKALCIRYRIDVPRGISAHQVWISAKRHNPSLPTVVVVFK